MDGSSYQKNMETLFSEVDMAEKQLEAVIAYAEDFFDSPEEKEMMLQEIRQNPEEIISSSKKPFMKKIAKAMITLKELQVKELSSPAFTKALADQKAFLEAQMNEKLAIERNRMEELVTQQHEYFQGQLAAEITRMERQLDDQKRMTKAAFALLSGEIEVKAEHTVNISKLLKRFMPAVAVMTNLSDVEWVREIDKCVPI